MDKRELLERTVETLVRQGLTVAFSGGVDSALLLKLACSFGLPVEAVLVRSRLMPLRDEPAAKQIAEECGARFTVLDLDLSAVPEVIRNDPQRCYFCKKALFSALSAAAGGVVADGTNADDLTVYRPGRRALQELGIRSPLAECGFTKREVRELAAKLGLSVAQRPASPCMATRLPYGTALDFAVLRRLEEGEAALHELGFPVCRLRLHGGVVRIEVPEARLADLLMMRERVLAALRPLGFDYWTLDLEGFRSGSMDIGVQNG